MSKFILIFAIYASSLVFTQRFSPLDAEIINLILRENQFELNELENDFEEITINVNCTAHQNMVIGQKGTFIFTTDYSDETLHIFDPDTIEQETSFITVMTDENGKSLNTSCRLWKPTEIIKIICDANFFEEGQHSVIINNQSFFYGNNQINITFYGTFVFKQEDIYYSFLYSYDQKINISENISIYELKFKYNTILYLYGNKDNYAVLDNCEKTEKEIICLISKEKIEEILISTNDEFKLGAINDILGVLEFTNVYPININYENVQKEDIYIELKQNYDIGIEYGAPLSFETNVSEIPNLISDKSDIISNVTFYFKKMNGKCLMLMVEYYFLPEFSVYEPEFPDGIVLKYMHYKYNFIIKPFRIDDSIIIIDSPGAKIFLLYPENINLATSNSSIIRFIMNNSSLIENIKLNLDSESDLECEDLYKMKKCIVPKSHFYMKRSGYFTLYHKAYMKIT